MKILAGAGAGAALALALLVAGCASAPDAADVPAPSSTPTSTPTPAARPAPEDPIRPVPLGRAGTGGQDVRYLGTDGRIETLRVEDFPR